MLVDGVYIMIIGMTFVFLFLCLMIMVMHATAKVLRIVNKYCPEQIEEKGKLEKVIEQHDDIAVVLAAVKAYVKG